MSQRLIQIHPSDNVAVAAGPVAPGADVQVNGTELKVNAEVPAGHKIALQPIKAGAPVVKYGFVIGSATSDIAPGDWVHSDNLKTNLSGEVTYEYRGASNAQPRASNVPTFLGYRRKNGTVGTRNEIWIINTVGCVNHAAERVAKLAADRFAANAGERFAGRIDGVHSFSHPYGCSQLGDDLKNTQRVLAGMLRHPNAGGVLVLGLGCENN